MGHFGWGLFNGFRKWLGESGVARELFAEFGRGDSCEKIYLV